MNITDMCLNMTHQAQATPHLIDEARPKRRDHISVPHRNSTTSLLLATVSSGSSARDASIASRCRATSATIRSCHVASSPELEICESASDFPEKSFADPSRFPQGTNAATTHLCWAVSAMQAENLRTF